MQLLEKIPNLSVKRTPHASVEFKLHAPHAKTVSVAGDFTEWIASARPLKRKSDGSWVAQLRLKPGRYEYKFIVDDEWQNDPASDATTPDGFGGENSVVEVTTA